MKTLMYEIAVIGNPLYNSVSTVEFQTEERILSGPAINISQVIAKLNVHEIVTIGAIGVDFRDRFANDIDILGIPEYYAIDSPSTGGFHISCDDGGAPTIELIGAARALKIRDIPEEFLNSEYIVIAPGYREIDSELVEWISDTSDATIILDVQGMGVRADESGVVHITPNASQITEAMGYSNIIRMERPLWRMITGETDPLLAAEYIVESGAEIGIAMVSSMGAVIYDGEEFYIVPLDRSTRRNVLGASDAFLGAFVVGMLQKKSMTERSALASSAASIVMETSCAEFVLSPEELNRRQQKISDRIVVK
ncbi:MAG: PfkB family carbohydrate kinase [Candidatus Thorarchaeota archaeon]